MIASTASPYKFAHSVMAAIDGKQDDRDEFAIVDDLSKTANLPVPQAVEEIRTAPIRHTRVCDRTDMEKEVAEILGL